MTTKDQANEIDRIGKALATIEDMEGISEFNISVGRQTGEIKLVYRPCPEFKVHATIKAEVRLNIMKASPEEMKAPVKKKRKA